MDLKKITNKNGLKESWISYMKENAFIKDDNYLNELFDRYYRNGNINIYNSATGKDFNIDSHKFINDTLKQYVIVENGVLFYNHNVKVDPAVKTIDVLKDGRSGNKGRMKKAMEVSDNILATFYNNAQQDDKLFLNTNYGIELNPYSRFYNYDVASSTTIRGRSTVSMNGVSIEMIFGNYRPYSLLLYLNFINEVSKKDISKYSEYLREPSNDEILHHLLLDRYDNYYAKDILKKRIEELSNEDKKKVFYSCNFYEIVKTEYAQKLIYEIFDIQNKDYYKVKKMIDEDDPNRFKNFKKILFLDPLKPSENVKDKVDELLKFMSFLIKGYYWYEGDFLPNGKYLTSTQEVFRLMERERVIVTDTDSLIIFINTLMDDIKNEVKDFDKVTDNFDKLMLDYTLASIIVAQLSYVLGEGLSRYTEHTLIPKEFRHIISYKQEFLFRTLQVTEGAKNYLGIIGIQEGVFLKNEKADIKGLSLKKSNFNKKLSEIAEEIAVDMIAKKDNPDIRSILKKVEESRVEILNMYKSKENIDLFTVSKLKVSFGGLPEGESRIKACRLYNALYGKDIQLPGSFLVAKLKFADVEEELKENYPKEYEILNKEALRRTKIANITSMKNRLESKKDELTGYEILDFGKIVDKIKKAKSTEEIKNLLKDKRKENKVFKILSPSTKTVKIKDINKIALPLDSEEVPEFITTYIDSDDLVIFENLASVIVKGIGIETVRNVAKQEIITNVVSYY